MSARVPRSVGLRWLLAPGRALMGRLSYGKKLLVLGFVTLTPLCLLALTRSLEAERQLEDQTVRVAAMAQIGALRQLLVRVGEHGLLATAELAGDQRHGERLRQLRQEIDDNVKQEARLRVWHPESEVPHKLWDSILEAWREARRETWKDLHACVETHEQLQQAIQVLLLHEAAVHDVLVGDRGTVWLLIAHTKSLPAVTTSMTSALMRLTELTVQNGALLTAGARARMQESVDQLNRALDELARVLPIAFRADAPDRDPGLHELRVYADALIGTGQRLSQFLRRRGSEAAVMDVQPLEVRDWWVETELNVFAFSDVVGRRVQERSLELTASHRRAARFAIALAAGTCLLALYLFAAFWSSVNYALDAIRSFTRQMIVGTSEEFRVDTRDELSTVVDAYNRINRALVESRELSVLIEDQRKIAQRASRVKSEFLASVSHELCTPMNVILSMNRFLLETPLSDEQRGLVGTSTASSEHLLQIIERMIDFAAMESSQRVEVRWTQVTLEALIERVRRRAREACERKGLAFRFACGEAFEQSVLADASVLQKALLELVSNAVKFTERGEVVLEVVGRSARGGAARRIEFSVTDTGIGVPARDVPRLFQPIDPERLVEAIVRLKTRALEPQAP